jgi:hypothetical protein
MPKVAIERMPTMVKPVRRAHNLGVTVGEEAWPYNCNAADCRLRDAEQYAENFALFRPGTRPQDFTLERKKIIEQVCHEWSEVAKKFDKYRKEAKGTLNTVRRARSTGAYAPVENSQENQGLDLRLTNPKSRLEERRIGRDGKARRLPQPQVEPAVKELIAFNEKREKDSRARYRAKIMKRIKPDSLRGVLLAAFEKGSMTGNEACAVVPNVKRRTVTATVYSLMVNSGLLRDSGERRKTKAGGRAEIVYENDPYPMLPFGHPETACNRDWINEKPAEGQEAWPFNCNAADDQLQDAIKITKDFGLFRPGTRSQDFTPERKRIIDQVCRAWLEVARKFNEYRKKGKGTLND